MDRGAGKPRIAPGQRTGRFLVLLLCATALAGDRGPVTVRVVGPTGALLSDIGIGNGRVEGEGELLGRTGEDGTLRLNDLPYDGSAFLSVHDKRLPGRRIITADGFVPFDVQGGAVTGPELTIRTAGGVPYTLTFVDAETGRVIPGLAWSDGSVRPRAAPRQVVFAADGLRAKLPEGFTTDRDWRLIGPSIFAREARAIIPLRHAVYVNLRVLLHDGTPAAGAGATEWTSGNHDFTGDEGRLRLGPIPFFHGSTIRVGVTYYVGGDSDAPFRGPESSVLRRTWEHRLRAKRRTEVRGTVRLPPEREAVRVNANRPTGIVSPEPPALEGTGSVTVRALRFNGEPAAHARVSLEPVESTHRRITANLDERGSVRIEGLGPGEWRVASSARGLLTTTATVRIRNEDSSTVVLREDEPGAIAVAVVDGRGGPFHSPGCASWMRSTTTSRTAFSAWIPIRTTTAPGSFDTSDRAAKPCGQSMEPDRGRPRAR